MLGEIYERRVLYYAAWMARHEPLHLKHIGRIIAAGPELEADIGDFVRFHLPGRR